MIRFNGPPLILSLYIGRRFLAASFSMLGGLTLIAALFDFLDLLRQAADKPKATLGIVAEMEILRIPYLGMRILPFAVLLGGIYAFWRLARSSELVVARAAGVSAWQFLTVPVLYAALLGAATTGLVSPLSAAMFSRSETLYALYLEIGAGPLSLTGGQLWLRQTDRGLKPDGIAVLHARSVKLAGRVLHTGPIAIFRLGADSNLLERIDATHARLGPAYWHLDQVSVLQPDAAPQRFTAIHFPTDLTVARVQESFASPSALSFWSLPGFITILKRAGFSPTRHELAFQTLLALPLLCATMVLLAAGFSMRPARRGGTIQILTGGITCGFALFMVSDVAAQFGESGALPVTLAAWAPAAAGLMLSLALLLHLEDG